MSRYTCNTCSACEGKCDKCSANVCINNMEKHREIFKLNDDFNNVIYYTIQNLYNKCCEIKIIYIIIIGFILKWKIFTIVKDLFIKWK